MTLEAFLSDLTLKGAVLIEGAACLIVFVGAVGALYRLAVVSLTRGPLIQRRTIYTNFGTWLLFGLEFELAADIIRSAITPNWTDIAQLGAIALIRTFLNHFLAKDIEQTNALTRQS